MVFKLFWYLLFLCDGIQDVLFYQVNIFYFTEFIFFLWSDSNQHT